MGKRLSSSESMASDGAAKMFERKFGHESYRMVSVIKKSKNILVDEHVEVHVFPQVYAGTDLRRVDIFWEEAGIGNYRDIGLYGMYSCVYCKMKFENETLFIEGNNGLEIYIK